MVKKAPRDPGAPKRNQSAYLLYQNSMRGQFKALNPGMTFGQLAKYTSAMYAELPAEEKETWQARAEADKARYLNELASYIPPPGYDAKGDALMAHPPTKTRKSKAEKDPLAPKRNQSAYLLYQNAMRSEFKESNPGMTFGQLSKFTSSMYKNLTAEEVAMWEARAAEDKARYETEIAAYVPPPGHDARGVLIDDQRPRKKNKRGNKDPRAPKRASGAYVFFTNYARPQIMSENPEIKFVDMGRELGERWRSLDPESKKKYEEMAAADKVRFQNEMKEYSANQAALALQQQQQQQQAEEVQTHVAAAYHYQDPYAAAQDIYGQQQVYQDPYADQYHAA